MYNGLFAFLGSTFWVLFLRDIRCGKQNTIYETILFANMSAHFIWDTVYMQYQGFLDFGNFLHHVMGVLVYGTAVVWQHNLYLGMLHFVPGESTNVAMHLREFIKRFGMRCTWAYYTNEYYYCGAYMICRGIFIPCVYYFWYTCESSGPLYLIFFPIHIVQSWYYVSKLPKMWRVRDKERVLLKKAKLTLAHS
jgi:hypothetical protein